MKTKNEKKEAPKRNFIDTKTLIPILKKCKRVFVDEYYVNKNDKKEMNRCIKKQSIKGIPNRILPGTDMEGYYNFSISYTQLFPIKVVKIPVKYEHVEYLQNSGILEFVNGLKVTLYTENNDDETEENQTNKKNEENTETMESSIFDRKFYNVTDKIHTSIDILEEFSKMR